MQKLTDEYVIAKCIKLAYQSYQSGESPFACIITTKNSIVVQAKNQVKKKNDFTCHAELMAIRKLRKKHPRILFSSYNLYSVCEPCPMCAFMIREYHFQRVIYAVKSPFMGGHTKWNILEDAQLEKFNSIYTRPPKVLGGILASECLRMDKKCGWEELVIE